MLAHPRRDLPVIHTEHLSFHLHERQVFGLEPPRKLGVMGGYECPKHELSDVV